MGYRNAEGNQMMLTGEIKLLRDYFKTLLDNNQIEDIKLDSIDQTQDKVIYNVTMRINAPIDRIAFGLLLKDQTRSSAPSDEAPHD